MIFRESADRPGKAAARHDLGQRGTRGGAEPGRSSAARRRQQALAGPVSCGTIESFLYGEAQRRRDRVGGARHRKARPAASSADASGIGNLID